MNDQPANERPMKLLEAWRGEDSPPAKEARLTDMQKEFCLQYVTNGGNATEAATVAGYAHPDVVAVKLMLHFGCVHMINRLTVELWKGKIPQLLANLHGVAFNEKATDRARVDATNSLLDRLGVTVPKGPSTAIQINNGTAADGVLKGQAQVIIKELWDIRETREQRKAKAYDAVDRVMDAKEQRKRSDIVDRMSDNPDPALQLLEHIAHDDGRGGELSQGPVGSPSSIPAPPPTHDENFQKESEDDGENECSRGTLGGDPTGGFGGGEGAAGSVQWVAGGGDIVADEGGGGIDAEVFSGFHADDAEGYGSDVGVDGRLARGTALWSGAASGSHSGGFGREHSDAGDIGEAAGRSEAVGSGGHQSGSGGVDLFADD